MPQPTRRAGLEAVLDAPWALHPSTLSRVAAYVRDPSAGPARVVAMDGPQDGAVRVGTVSVIPVYGVIENHTDWICEMLGGTSVDGLREDLAEELADPSVRAVVLDIDSPGGTVAGMTELAADIRAMRGGAKPIVAVANTLAASAAYWLASQCDEVVCTPSGSVGSVGVYAVHQEVSRMLDEMGVTTTLVSAGPHKTDGNEFEPLSDGARADIQSRVDAAYATFLDDVAAGRRVTADEVAAGYGGGRVLVARDALRAGMVDRVATLAQTVTRLGRAAMSAGPSSRARASSPLLDFAASAIAAAETPTDDGPWDAGEMERRCPADESALRASHAWVDPDGDPSLKGSYKFVHHLVAEDGTVGAANLTACSDGIGYLNRAPGATGRPDIPDADRAGVHAHLAAHLADGGREAPALHGEGFTQRVASLALEAEQLAAHAAERARLRAKEGRPAFSTTTERSLRAIRGAIDGLLALDDPAPADPIPEPPDDPAPDGRPAPPTAATAPRFRSRADWLRHLEATAR